MSAAERVVEKGSSGGETDQKGRILPIRATSSGWDVLTIHWSAVPGYNYDEAAKGLSPQGKRTELEIDWSASMALPVYPEYDPKVHVALDPLEFDPNKPLYIGLDAPGCPAATPTQQNMWGQWQLFPSLSPPEEEGLGFYEFCVELRYLLQDDYAAPHGLKVEDLDLRFVGDPAGGGRRPRTGQSPNEVQSCWEIMRDGLKIDMGYDQFGRPVIERKPGFGWKVTPGAVHFTERSESVRARLNTMVRGAPALIIDPNARTIKEGFAGAYHYPQRTDGRYELDPAKNHASHTMNALEYVASVLFKFARRDAQSRDAEDEDYRPRRRHVSSAACRRR